MALATHKRERYIGAGLRFQRVSPLLAWREEWWHAGRHGARKAVESFTSNPQSAGRESH